MKVSDELIQRVESAWSELLEISDTAAGKPPGPTGWSAKEIIGHLIDSAIHNANRFVRAQVSEDLIFEGYDQDAWVRIQRYRERPWGQILQLWRSLNYQIAHIMECTPEERMILPRAEHNLHEIAWQSVPADQFTTLGYLMEDYVGHLRHHLNQLRAQRAQRLSE